MKKVELYKMVELQYIYSAMEILATAFDMLVTHVGFKASTATNIFFATETFDYYEIKSPRYMAGIGGRELVHEMLDKINFKSKKINFDYIDFHKTKEYWAMYMMVYYKYKRAKTFRELFSKVGIDDVIKMYHPLHEASFEKFLDEIDEAFNDDTLSKKLVLKRKLFGISQSQLAKMSGVNLRTLQKYETGEKDLMKASYETVRKLKTALNVCLT